MTSSELVFGCVPHTDDEQTRTRLIELCEWLSARVGTRVRPHRAPSPGALASAFGAGRIDVAWVSPSLLLTSPALENARPLVSSIRQGLAGYHAALFVEKSSRWRSPSDLRGARAAWVAESSASGYIVPRLSLAAHGLDPRELFASERFYDSHGNVTRAVLGGTADVGATFAVFERGDPMAKLVGAGFLEVPGAEARILHVSGPIPSDPIIIAPHLATPHRIELLDAFTHGVGEILPAVRHVLGADAFEAVRPASFDALREEIRHGRELGLLDGGDARHDHVGVKTSG